MTMKYLLTLVFLLTTLASVTATTTPALLGITPAPASAPKIAVAIDSLPMGYHRVSSYRNGERVSATVEDGEITALSINGQAVDAANFGQYRERVARMMGTQKPSWEETEDPLYLTPFGGDPDVDLETHFEAFGQRWEDIAEDLGRLGEALGEKFERMIEMENDSQRLSIILNGDGQGSYHFRFDSTGYPMVGDEPQMETFESMVERLDRERTGAERQMKDAELKMEDAERQIEDAERRMKETERRMKESERQIEDAARKVQNRIRTPNFERLIGQLETEGMMAPTGPVKRLKLTDEYLRVNGKRASPAAYARFRELFREQTGTDIGAGTSISIKKD